MNLTEMIGELSPSAQRAVLRYTASLHMMESLCVPGQGEAANCVPDPRRMPGSIDAAGTLRLILLKSKDAEHVRRRAHREIVAMAHSQAELPTAPPTASQATCRRGRGVWRAKGEDSVGCRCSQGGCVPSITAAPSAGARRAGIAEH